MIAFIVFVNAFAGVTGWTALGPSRCVFVPARFGICRKWIGVSSPGFGIVVADVIAFFSITEKAGPIYVRKYETNHTQKFLVPYGRVRAELRSCWPAPG